MSNSPWAEVKVVASDPACKAPSSAPAAPPSLDSVTVERQVMFGTVGINEENVVGSHIR
jgi:hypothetical protein